MFSVIREELPTVVNELASTAKVSTEQVGRLAEMEVASTATTAGAGAGLNPLAVRQMASASIKEGGKSFVIQCGEELISRIINLIIPTPRPQSNYFITRTSPHSKSITINQYINDLSDLGDGCGSEREGSYFECDSNWGWGSVGASTIG